MPRVANGRGASYQASEKSGNAALQMLQTSVRLRAHRCVDTSRPGSSDGRCPKIAGGIRLRATLARPAAETTKLRLSTLQIRSVEPRVKKSPQALAPGHEAQKKHGWDAPQRRGGLTRRHACDALFGPSFLFGPAPRLSASSPILPCSTRGLCPSSTSPSARRLLPAEVEGCDAGVDTIELQRGSLSQDAMRFDRGGRLRVVWCGFE